MATVRRLHTPRQRIDEVRRKALEWLQQNKHVEFMGMQLGRLCLVTTGLRGFDQYLDVMSRNSSWVDTVFLQECS